MRKLLISRVLACAVLLTVATGTVRGQDGDLGVMMKRLEGKSEFVELFREEFLDTYDLLEAEIRQVIDDHDRPAEATLLHRRTLLKWAGHLLAAGEQDKAFDRYETVCGYGGDTEEFKTAALGSAAISESRADAAGDDEGRLGHLESALARYEAAGDSRKTKTVQGRIVAIYTREGMKHYGKKDYGKAYDSLAAASGKVSLEGTPAGEAWDFLENETAECTVAATKIDPRVGGTALSGGAKVRLVARRGGENRNLPSDFGREWSERWVVGDYRVQVSLPGGASPVLDLPFSVTKSGGRIQIPDRFPSGMVYIPAGVAHVPERRELRAFFIDVREVSVREWKAFKGASYRPWYKEDGMPAHDVSLDDAERYAAAAGKKLPTRAQWIRAAFGDSRQAHPFGARVPTAPALVVGGRPMLTGRPSAETTAFGVRDMGGNVSEWLRDGWALGASYKTGKLEKVLGGKNRRYMRDPRPGPRVWRANPSIRPEYRSYRIIPDENQDEVGLRCVVEL